MPSICLQIDMCSPQSCVMTYLKVSVLNVYQQASWLLSLAVFKSPDFHLYGDEFEFSLWTYCQMYLQACPVIDLSG